MVLKTGLSPVVRIKGLAASERKITAEVLECIREIEAKSIHLSMDYPNLVVFLVKECCYSESAALRRISAARLIQQLPKMQEEIRSGNLSLSQVFIVAQGVRQKEKEGGKVSVEVKQMILDAVKQKGSIEAQKITAQVLELPKIVKDKVTVHGDETQTVQMNFSKEELELFERAKEVMGHIQPGMSKKELVVEGLKMILKHRDPARPVRQRASATTPKSGTKNGGKHKSVTEDKKQVAGRIEVEEPSITEQNELGRAELRVGGPGEEVRKMKVIFQGENESGGGSNRSSERKPGARVENWTVAGAGEGDDADDLRVWNLVKGKANPATERRAMFQ